jgi:membrane protease YdiL (CAAX protease family)
MKKIPLWAKVYILSFLLQIALFAAISFVENDGDYSDANLALYNLLHLMIFAVSLLTPSFFRKNLDRAKRWGIRFLSPGLWYFLGWAVLVTLIAILWHGRQMGVEPG